MAIPEISHEDDVYHVGSLCQAKVVHDKNNPLIPYMLSVAHQQKAEITEFIQPAKSLSRVNIAIRDHGRISGKSIEKEDLPHQGEVIFQFLQEEYNKLKRITRKQE